MQDCGFSAVLIYGSSLRLHCQSVWNKPKLSSFPSLFCVSQGVLEGGKGFKTGRSLEAFRCWQDMEAGPLSSL